METVLLITAGMIAVSIVLIYSLLLFRRRSEERIEGQRAQGKMSAALNCNEMCAPGTGGKSDLCFATCEGGWA